MSPDREEAIRALDRLSDEEIHDIVHRIAQDPRASRATGLQAKWRRWSGTIAFAFLVAFGAIGFWQVGGAVDQINKERAARTTSVSGIINQICQTNNSQDLLLALLVNASTGQMQVVTIPNATKFDLAVEQTIAKYQEAARDSSSSYLETFRKVEAELVDTDNCKDLVKHFQEGEPVKVSKVPTSLRPLIKQAKQGHDTGK